MNSRVAGLLRDGIDRWCHEARRAGRLAVAGPAVLLVAGAGFLLLVHAVHQPVGRIAGSLLEAVVPLGAAIAVAGLVGGDPAVELQLSLPASYRATLARRFCVTVACSGLTALIGTVVFTRLKVWQVPAGVLVTELAWVVPLAALCAAAAAVAAVTGSGRVSAGVVAGLWVAEEYFKPAFITPRWSQPLYLFATARANSWPYLVHGQFTHAWFANRGVLSAVAVALVVLAWVALRRANRLLSKGDVLS